MKKVCFIGGYKKTDMILYIAKMLTLANKSVLVIDATTEQRAKYVVPSIKPTFSYITNYENIDVAIGFLNLLEIKDYLSEEEPNYDYALIDIDNSQAAENFQKFQDKGWLIQDEKENYYIYAQTMNGKTQYGLVVGAYVPDYMNGIIKKHELTRRDKVEDRMKHVRVNNDNIEPVFFAYPDNKILDMII